MREEPENQGTQSARSKPRPAAKPRPKRAGRPGASAGTRRQKTHQAETRPPRARPRSYSDGSTTQNSVTRAMQISPENSRKLAGVWPSVQVSFVAVTCTDGPENKAQTWLKSCRKSREKAHRLARTSDSVAWQHYEIRGRRGQEYRRTNSLWLSALRCMWNGSGMCCLWCVRT